MGPDNLTDIAVFVRVVDRGSFTAAAAELGLSRPAVSKYVSRLEARLGARLLHRTTRRLGLTEVGRLFYERSRHGLAEIEEAGLEVSRLQAEPRGVLKLNAPMSFGVLHVAPALPAFRQRYPEVTVDMLLDDRQVDVIESGFDVSIRISALHDSSLVARRLAPCRHVVVAAPDYLDRQGRPRTPDDLRAHAAVAYRYQSSALDWHFRDRDGHGVSVTVQAAMTLNSSLAIREAVVAGAGIARMPTFVVGPDIQAGRLVSLLPGWSTLEVSIYLVYPERRHLSPKVRAFAEFMAARISATPYWDRLRPEI